VILIQLVKIVDKLKQIFEVAFVFDKESLL